MGPVMHQATTDMAVEKKLVSSRKNLYKADEAATIPPTKCPLSMSQFLTDQHSPLLTVLVAVYNAAPYLHKCMTSLSDQTYGNLEIICVDDGSTDESPQILESYARQDPRIIVIHQVNSGLGTARNTGLKIAKGELVTAVDADDYLIRDCYEKALSHLDDSIDLVSFGIQPVGDDQEYVQTAQGYYTTPVQGTVAITPCTIPLLTHNSCNKIFRRRIIEQYHIRFAEGLWYEDVAFAQKYFSVCRRAFILPDKLYMYLLRQDSIMGQTRRCNVKALDIIPIVDSVYDFYRSHGLWDRMRQQVHQLTQEVFNYRRNVPAEHRGLANRECAAWIRRWQLCRLFPGDYRLAKASGSALRALVVKLFSTLFFSQKPGKWHIALMGLPLYGQQIKHGRLIHKVFGLRLASRPLW